MSPVRQSVNLLRVLLIGTGLAVPFAFWLQYVEMVQREGLFAVESALPLPALVGLLLLVGVHGVLRWLGVERWLPRAEVLLIYAFLLITVPLASYGLAQPLLAHLTAGHYYANPSNDFQRVLTHVPAWVGPSDAEHLRALYDRNIQGTHYGAWVVPLSRWIILLGAFFVLCLCLSLLVEQQWAFAERLRFPLTSPALELTSTGPSRMIDRPLLWDPVMWIGVAWSLFYGGTAVVAAFVPTFPSLYFGGSIGPLQFSYRPVILGIAYLAPTHLSLSIWVFELVKAGQVMLGETFGLASVGGTASSASSSKFPFHPEQALGAFLFLALMSLWTARQHVSRTMRSMAWRGPNSDATPARAAVIGTVASSLVIVTWLAWSGFFNGAILGFLVLLLFIAVTHARIRAEAGPPVIWTTPYRPDTLMLSMAGSSHFSTGSLAQMGVFGFLGNSYFPLLMATQLDALKMSIETRVRRRDVVIVLIAALLVGSFAGIWSLLHFWYAEGADSLFTFPLRSAQRSYAAAAANMKYPTGTDFYALGAAGAGFAFTALLALGRRLVWFWPIHPLGYAISQTSSTHMWAMYLVAWAVKYHVIRFGGLRAYRFTVPFFFGLIFGQIGMLIASNAINYFCHTRIYVSAF
jgi:hypothetical protein